MLIAIMADVFEMAMQEKDNNSRINKLKIMGDYVDLIQRKNVDDLLAEEEQQANSRESAVDRLPPNKPSMLKSTVPFAERDLPPERHTS